MKVSQKEKKKELRREVCLIMGIYKIFNTNFSYGKNLSNFSSAKTIELIEKIILLKRQHIYK